MIIVRSKDSKMLQDTVAGMIITPTRPHLAEMNSFTEGRLNKTEYRPQELELLVSDFTPNDKITDKTLEADWLEYKGELKKGAEPDHQAFADAWAKENGRIGKNKAKVAAGEEGDKTPPNPNDGRNPNNQGRKVA